MNYYRTKFIAECPLNGIPIHYELVIVTAGRVIPVEVITKATRSVAGFHESIADDLQAQLGGADTRTTLSAFHHGVEIETTRGEA